MFRLQDRGGRDMVLAMTHEEVFAWLASRELRSYRDLPQIWYQLQLKFRDEPRPKGGVLRVREFLMKDSYSFDLDEAGLEESYAEAHRGLRPHLQPLRRRVLPGGERQRLHGRGAGPRVHRAFARRGGPHRCVRGVRLRRQRGAGALGGFAAGGTAGRRSGSGRRVRWTARPRESADPRAAHHRPRCRPSWSLEPSAIIKASVYMAGDEPVMALVRGDHSLHESKLARYLKAEVRPARPEEVVEATGVEVGLRRTGRAAPSAALRLIADETLAAGRARRPARVRGGRQQAPYAPHGSGRGPGLPAGVRRPARGDRRATAVPSAAEPLTVEAGHRGGQHLQARHQVLEAAGGHGSGRVRAGAAHHHGFIRHRPGAYRGRRGGATERRARHRVAQGHRPVRRPPGAGADQGRGADRGGAALYDDLVREGWEVLWDDRDERPGFKFADAELIGCPVRVTVGKKARRGSGGSRARGAGTREEVAAEACAALVRRLWEAAR